MPESADPLLAVRGLGRSKALIDAMQAQGALAPGVVAMAKAASFVSPSAVALAKSTNALGVTGRIGGQHGFAKLVAGIKPASGVGGAAEVLRRATDGFAVKPYLNEGALSTSKMTRMMAKSQPLSLTEALAERAVAVSSGAVPPLPNYTAELLKLQRQIETRRGEERAIEDERHEQSLAVQRAMHEALLETEAARAADAEAAALREQALVDRAESAEDRAEESDAREAKMLRLTMMSVGIGGLSFVVAVAAGVATIAI